MPTVEVLKKPAGGQTKYSEEIVRQLEAAFHIDATIEEACAYADITKPTYYSWLQKVVGFALRMEKAQQMPLLKAKKTVLKTIEEGDGRLSMDFLKSRQPKRYADRLQIIPLPASLPELAAEEERLRIEIEDIERGGGGTTLAISEGTPDVGAEGEAEIDPAVSSTQHEGVEEAAGTDDERSTDQSLPRREQNGQDGVGSA